MAGRAGSYDPLTERWSDVIYMPCTADNGFAPDFPKETPDLIYLCFPNNPTGATITKEQLQGWVDYANRVGAVILFDAAYEAYISEEDVPHSIYECEGARTCAIELRFFFKKCRLYGNETWIYGRTKGSEVRWCHAAFPVGETARHKVQRSALHCSEGR